jgi:hypothetical protein
VIDLGYGFSLPEEFTEEDVDEVLASIPGLQWSRADWRDFRACPPDVQKRNLTILAASAQNPGPDWAGKTLTVLKVILAVASGVAGITGAIAGVQGVKW